MALSPSIKHGFPAIARKFDEILARLNLVLDGSQVQHCVACCREDGKLLGLRINLRATAVWSEFQRRAPHQWNAIFLVPLDQLLDFHPTRYNWARRLWVKIWRGDLREQGFDLFPRT